MENIKGIKYSGKDILNLFVIMDSIEALEVYAKKYNQRTIDKGIYGDVGSFHIARIGNCLKHLSSEIKDSFNWLCPFAFVNYGGIYLHIEELLEFAYDIEQKVKSSYFYEEFAKIVSILTEVYNYLFSDDIYKTKLHIQEFLKWINDRDSGRIYLIIWVSHIESVLGVDFSTVGHVRQDDLKDALKNIEVEPEAIDNQNDNYRIADFNIIEQNSKNRNRKKKCKNDEIIYLPIMKYLCALEFILKKHNNIPTDKKSVFSAEIRVRSKNGNFIPFSRDYKNPIKTQHSVWSFRG